MNTYQFCPRCSSAWKEYKDVRYTGTNVKCWQCISCPMIYRENINQYVLLLPSPLEIKDHNLFWDINSRICKYGSIHQMVNGGIIELPWLPFDISPEKLKTYILFS